MGRVEAAEDDQSVGTGTERVKRSPPSRTPLTLLPRPPVPPSSYTTNSTLPKPLAQGGPPWTPNTYKHQTARILLASGGGILHKRQKWTHL